MNDGADWYGHKVGTTGEVWHHVTWRKGAWATSCEGAAVAYPPVRRCDPKPLCADCEDRAQDLRSFFGDGLSPKAAAG